MKKQAQKLDLNGLSNVGGGYSDEERQTIAKEKGLGRHDPSLEVLDDFCPPTGLGPKRKRRIPKK